MMTTMMMCVDGVQFVCCLMLCILQADILDVNQIFRDLGMLVHEQGEVIGNFCFRLQSLLFLLHAQICF